MHLTETPFQTDIITQYFKLPHKACAKRFYKNYSEEHPAWPMRRWQEAYDMLLATSYEIEKQSLLKRKKL